MIFNTYGSIENPHIMLIHGAGYGWWNFINYIDTLSKSYYVILPTLDGHSEDSETPYTSTEHCAEQIIQYIKEKSCKKLHLLYGLSLGGQVVLEMISLKSDVADKAVIDGSICYPQPKLAKTAKFFIKYFYNLMFSKTACKIQVFLLKFSKKRTFTDIQQQMYMKFIPVLKKETLYSIYNTYMALYSLKPEIKKAKTDLIYMYGSKEMKCVKLSAEKLKELLPSLKIIEHKGLNHGELALYYPDKFLTMLNNFL